MDFGMSIILDVKIKNLQNKLVLKSAILKLIK